MLQELISIIYPQLCLSCQRPLNRAESNMCVGCKAKLPRTHFAIRSENPIFSLLWGKVEVEHASSVFYFRKGNVIQKLMHQLKYKGQQQAGIELGVLMATELKKSDLYKNIDLVVPVPLHASKKRLRGYNQCDSIANGIAKTLNIEVKTNAVKRTRANATQTRKGHFDRHENVKSLFQVVDKSALNNKQVLLIDDVITTGSTLASCANSINKSTTAKLFVSTLAVAIQS